MVCYLTVTFIYSRRKFKDQINKNKKIFNRNSQGREHSCGSGIKGRMIIEKVLHLKKGKKKNSKIRHGLQLT